MKTWDDWSDFEVNAAVTCIDFGCDGWELNEASKNFFHCGADGSGYYVQQVVDYCNNWADMGPLIVENRIAAAPHPLRRDDRGLWMCIADDERGIYTRDGKNPLRAAAIVFLMMNGVKP